MRVAALAFALLAVAPGPLAASSAEGILAADAAVYAPPDLKRQLVKHRSRLMQGVADAAESDDGKGGAAAHRAAAVRAARDIAQRIRGRTHFDEIAYEVGGLVHECAAIDGLPAAPPPRALFSGFSAAPFGDPAALLSAPGGADPWNAALTRATRLIAWIWKAAGGDASIALRMPEAKGPYAARE